MSSAPLRWGISSTGDIAAQMTHALRSIRSSHDVEVVAVGSRTQASADAFAVQHGIGRAYGSFLELCHDPDIDVVYVASPHSEHHSMTIAALSAGKHVLCEKPFAVNADQARRMISHAKRTRRTLVEGMWSWTMPAWHDIRRRIDAGDLGSITAIDANFGMAALDPNGRHRRIELGGGALLDLGIYPLALARFVLGEPDDVRALASLTDRGVDATLGAVLRFGTSIAVMTTTIDAATDHRASIVGTKGRIEIDPPFWFPSAYTVVRTLGEGFSPPSVAERVRVPNRGLAHEAQHVCELIRKGALQSDTLSWKATIAGMQLLDDIRHQVGVSYPEDEARQ